MSDSALTSCWGRFMLDLPPNARTRSTFISGGARVLTTAAVAPEGVEQLLQARETELAARPHGTGGSMLVERYALSERHQVIVSWSSAMGKRTQRYEEFQYFPDGRVLFRFESQGDATAAARERARVSQAKFGAAMRVREPAVMPTEPGFCVERGFVAGSALNREEVEAVISFPAMAHVSMAFKSIVTRNPEPALLERVRELPADLADQSSGIAVVRRTMRTLDGLEGSEVVVEERDEGRTSHEFAWEFPGKVDSLAAPFLKLGMTLDEGALGEEGEFRDLEEAIEFWHGITASLRLRPGAV